MRIRFLTSLAMNHSTYAFGEQVDLPDDEAKGLVAVGHAEALDPVAPADDEPADPPPSEADSIETAVSSHFAEEHAVGKTARKKRS